jgi:hypothetical protein
MILVEYLIAQIQVGSTSYAVVSSRRGNNNPMVNIESHNGSYVWGFLGLTIGAEEHVIGDPRQDHVDVYFGLDDLMHERQRFPQTGARSLSLTANGLRIPVRQVRRGGTPIAWLGPLARLNFSDITMFIPPYKVTANSNAEMVLNIDREFAQYTINNGNGQTTRELHLGFENAFVKVEDRRVRIPRITLTMNSRQYATVLNAIDAAITLHRSQM